MKQHYTLILLCIFLLTLTGFAQTVNDQFNKGLILYRNHQYEQAENSFQTLLDSDEPHAKMAIAQLMLAKSQLNQKKYDQCITSAESLVRNYPQSRYKAHAFYITGSARFYQNNIKSALRAFAFTIEYAKDNNLAEQAYVVGSNISKTKAGIRDIEQLLSIYEWKQAKAAIQLWSAQKNFTKGRVAQGTAIVNQLLEERPQEQYAIKAQNLLGKDWNADIDKIRIGVILPISGMFSAEANDFIRGMAFAMENRPNKNDAIDIILKDSQGTTVSLIKATRSLLSENVDLVVGELEGSKSAFVAEMASTKNIPVIVPVTTENGIANLGNQIFQANNDMHTRGRALAQYAIQELGMQTFATLAPADDYGHALTDAFTSTVDQLGGTIVSQQWYYSGTEDFKPQFESIRRAGFTLAFRDSLQKAGLPSTKSHIDSLFNVWNLASRRMSDDGLGLVKNNDIAVESIDGFFLPVYSEDIPFIASQMAFANIKSNLLGGEYWHDQEILKRQQRYVNGLVMVSGHYTEATDLDYITFVRDFRIQTATTPETLAFYGYNVMNLILDAIEAGNYEGNEIAEYLSKINNFQGLGMNISFNRHSRVNQSVNLLQFQDGLVSQIHYE